MIRSTLCTFTKQTIGLVRRRTSTKQRSIILVVCNCFHRCLGKLKNASRLGKSFSNCLTIVGLSLPAQFETAECGTRLFAICGQVNSLGHLLQLIPISFTTFLAEVAHLVHPTALM